MMNFEGSPEPIDFDFFDEGPSTKRNGHSNSPDYRSKPVRPLSGKRSNSARGIDGDHDHDSVRSVTSSRSSVSVRIPTATPTHDDGNDADYYSDDFDESDHKDRYKEKDNDTFHFKDDIGAFKNKNKPDGRSNKMSGRERESSSNSKSSVKSRPKSSAPRRRQRSRSNSSSSYTSTESDASESSSFTSESSCRSSRSGRDNESVTSVSPLQSPASSPIPKLEYDEQEMERETEKMRSVRFLEEDDTDQRYSSRSSGTKSGKGRPKSSKARMRPHSSPVKTPGYSNYGNEPPMRATEANELSMLLRAVLELDETPQSSELAALHEDLKKPLSGKRKNRPQSAPMPHQRMNMSFSNDEVKRIDRENRRLLDRIVGKSTQAPGPAPSTRSRMAAERKPTSHSAVKRQREQRRIEIENMQILKRIEAARANPQIKRESLLHEFHQQRKYANQVSKTPGGLSSRPTSAKRAGQGHGARGMGRASSVSSLGTDYTVDTETTSSSRRSRPRSAKWSDSGSSYHGAKPAWDDRFYLNQ